MEYIVTFKAKNACEIKTNNLRKSLNIDDEIKLALSVNNDEETIIYISPTERNENQENLSYEILIRNNNGQLKFISNNVKVYQIKNEYLVEIFNDVIIKDINILYSSNSTFSYNTIKTHLLFKNINIELPDCFDEIKSKNYGSITGFEFSKSTEKYLILLNNTKVLFSDYYNELKTEKNNLKILSNIHDIAKHGRLFTIDTSTQTIKEEIVYTQNKPKLVNNIKLIPLAFLQALKVKNFKLMKYYLSENLKEVGTLQNYIDFFQDYKKSTFTFSNNLVKANLFYQNSKNSFYGKTFIFELSGNKIDKITQNNL